MTITRLAPASLLLLTLAACNGYGGPAATVPQSAVAPSGLAATGSAGTVGGAAAAPAGVGNVSTTTFRR